MKNLKKKFKKCLRNKIIFVNTLLYNVIHKIIYSALVTMRNGGYYLLVILLRAVTIHVLQ